MTLLGIKLGCCHPENGGEKDKEITKEPILCHSKRKVGIGFCRYWIAKAGLVVDAKTFHNCENCGRVRVKNPWSEIKDDLVPDLKKALDKSLKDNISIKESN